MTKPRKPATIAERMATLRAANATRIDRRSLKQEPRGPPPAITWEAWQYRCADRLDSWQAFKPVPAHLHPATFVESGTFSDLWNYMQLRRIGVHGWIRSYPYRATGGAWVMMPVNEWNQFRGIIER